MALYFALFIYIYIYNIVLCFYYFQLFYQLIMCLVLTIQWNVYQLQCIQLAHYIFISNIIIILFFHNLAFCRIGIFLKMSPDSKIFVVPKISLYHQRSFNRSDLPSVNLSPIGIFLCEFKSYSFSKPASIGGLLLYERPAFLDALSVSKVIKGTVRQIYISKKIAAI